MKFILTTLIFTSLLSSCTNESKQTSEVVPDYLSIKTGEIKEDPSVTYTLEDEVITISKGNKTLFIKENVKSVSKHNEKYFILNLGTEKILYHTEKGQLISCNACKIDISKNFAFFQDGSIAEILNLNGENVISLRSERKTNIIISNNFAAYQDEYNNGNIWNANGESIMSLGSGRRIKIMVSDNFAAFQEENDSGRIWDINGNSIMDFSNVQGLNIAIENDTVFYKTQDNSGKFGLLKD